MLAGISLGVCQWAWLRRRLSKGWWWIVSTLLDCYLAPLFVTVLDVDHLNTTGVLSQQTYPCILDVEIRVSDSLQLVRLWVAGNQVFFHQDEQFKTAAGLDVHGVITLAENEILSITAWQIIAPRTADGWRPILGTLPLPGTEVSSRGRQDHRFDEACDRQNASFQHNRL